MVKCLKCEFEVPGTPAFCPNCGAPISMKMSDAEISKLVFRRFGKRYTEALEEAYTACINDLEDRSLHKNLFLMRRADLLSRENEYQDEAVKRFIEKNNSNPKLNEALSHYKLGLVFENGQKAIDAIKEYDKALSAIPCFASALLRSGMIHEALSRQLYDRQRYGLFGKSIYIPRALNDYVWALQADPQFPLAFYCLGLFLKANKKLDDALSNYAKCVALDPDCAAAHNNMGLIWVDKRDFVNAEREFNEVLRLFPGHPSALRNLELARRKKGRRRFF